MMISIEYNIIADSGPDPYPVWQGALYLDNTLQLDLNIYIDQINVKVFLMLHEIHSFKILL